MKVYYPAWICNECAKSNRGYMPKDHIATYHLGKCGWCNQQNAVTEPRDWKYPVFKSKGVS